MLVVLVLLLGVLARACELLQCEGLRHCTLSHTVVDLAHTREVHCPALYTLELVNATVVAETVSLSIPRVVLYNASTIDCSALTLTTEFLHISSDSEVTASGRAPYTVVEPAPSTPDGGGNGAFGSPSCHSSTPVTVSTGLPRGSLHSPESFGGQGSCPSAPSSAPRGGGTLRLATQVLELHGTVTSLGATGPANATCGGGAGGSVWVSATALSLGPHARVSVVGGDGVGQGGGGAGGRVYIQVDHGLALSFGWVTVYGGVTSPGVGDPPCSYELGGVGTSYIRSNTTTATPAAHLYCAYDQATMPQTVALAATPLNLSELEEPLTGLYLAYCRAQVVGGAGLLHADTLQVTASILAATDDDLLGITCGSMALDTDAVVRAPTVDIQCTDAVVLDPTSSISFSKGARLAAARVELHNDVLETTGSDATHLQITAETLVLGRQAQVGAKVVDLVAHASAEVAGTVTATYKPSDCLAPVAPNTTYALSVTSPVTRVTGTGTLVGSSVVVRGRVLDLAGTVSASAQGCGMNRGPGRGGLGPQLAAGGAGYGGRGGRGLYHHDVGPGGATYAGPDPVLRGSGGAGGPSGNGGPGGGVLHLHLSEAVHVSGTLESCGGPGGGLAAPGGGGGSGGSIALYTAALTGAGRIAVAGGPSGLSAGGGGGGVLHVYWPAPHAYNASADFTGQVDVAGGPAHDQAGEDGHPGVLASFPACRPGTAGLLCKACDPGRYTNGSVCVPCWPGSHAPDPGAQTCSPCRPGTFSGAGAVTCSPCSAGHYSPELGADTCGPCPSGSFAGPGQAGCGPCQPGSYSGPGARTCSECAEGHWSAGRAPTCYPCTGRPDHAVYSGAACAYACLPGYVYPHCETPWDTTVASFNGPVLFATAVLLSVVLASTPFLWCWHRSVRRAHTRYLSDVRRAHGRRRASDDSGYRGLLSYERHEAAAGLNYSWEKHHLHRVHLRGSNGPGAHGLALPEQVPGPLRDVVLADEWAALARRLTALAAWTTWETLAYAVLRGTPVAPAYLDRVRGRHLARLEHALHAYDYACFRSHRARALGSSLVLGHSRCLSLAWVDVLSLEAGGPGKPCVPLVLVCAGDGSFHAPFHVDVTDRMSKALAQYYGSKWFTFLASLNVLLRTLSAEALGLHAALHRVARYVHMMQCVGIGIGRHMPVGGVSIHLGYSPAAQPGDTARPALVVTPGSAYDPDPDPEVPARARARTSSWLAEYCSAVRVQRVDEVLSRRGDPTPRTPPPPATHWPRFLCQVLGRVAHLAAFQRRARTRSATLWAAALTLALALELVLVFVVCVLCMQLDHRLVLVFLLVPPFLCVVSPVLGLAALASGLPSMVRLFAGFNAASTLNAAAVLVGGASALHRGTMDVLSAVLMPLALVLTKACVAQLLLRYLPHVEHRHDLLLSRVEVLALDPPSYDDDDHDHSFLLDADDEKYYQFN